MALATETDPVQLVLDILEASGVARYTDGKPGRIVRSSEFSPSQKRDYEQGDAAYVYAVGDIQMQPLDGSGDSYTENAQVAVDIWTLRGESVARSLAEDVRDVINDYWTDNEANTEWVTVRVTSENDYTHETFRENPGQHDRHLVTATMMRVEPV